MSYKDEYLLSLISNKMSSSNTCLSLNQGLRGAPGVAGPQGPAGRNVSPQIKTFETCQCIIMERQMDNWLSSAHCFVNKNFLKVTSLFKSGHRMRNNGKVHVFFLYVGFTRTARRERITWRASKYRKIIQRDP